MIKFIKKYHIFILFITFVNLNSNAFSNDYFLDENNNLIDEIENILLLNDEERQNVALLTNAQNDKAKKSEIPNLTISAKKSNFKININIKNKEKIAYNNYLSGQYEAAIELYKQILIDDEKNNYAKYSLALIYQKIGQLNDAKKLYRELLKDNPQNREEIILNLLNIMAKESPKEAIYLILRLTNQHPDSAYLVAQIALIYFDLKDYEKSAYYMQKATEINPENVNYIYNLAIIYDKQKNYEKAVEAYYKVLKNSQNMHNKSALDQIKSRLEEIR